MQREQVTFRMMRRRLLAQASTFALQVALRPRVWSSGLLAAGLIGCPHAPVLAQEIIDLATDAELVIQGPARSPLDPGTFGFSVSGAGDINGDGIDDLIIGDPRTRNLDSHVYAGISYVIFGSDEGLPAVIDFAIDAADLVLNGTLIDLSGNSVSGAGDVNGDGIDDLIIGAPGFFPANPYGFFIPGKSYVIFGSENDLPATIDLATEADLTIQGAANFGQFGFSVSGAGDVNGDGIDDLIIGTPGASLNVRLAGAAYVIFGSDRSLPAMIDLATNAAELVVHGAVAGDRLGTSVSDAGDINGDGIDDLIIAALSGAYVIFGSEEDFPATIDLATDAADVEIQGAAVGNLFAPASVSGAGDINGDGIDDLIIGAGGASYIVFGGSDLVTGTIIDLATGADVVLLGGGSSVNGAGDVGGDGVDDLIIGAPGASPNGRAYAGTSHVIGGSEQGLPAAIDLETDANLIIQGAAPGDSSGRSVSGAGDVNGDGIDDLIIGAHGADPNGRDRAGASYVVFGGPAAAIERLIARIEAAGLPGGIDNSLISKLRSGLGHLARGQITGAFGNVGDFIDQVEAQRGKQIDEADADLWLAAAETILDMLSTS